MQPDSPTARDERSPGPVVAAVDNGMFLVADVSRDEAWLGMSQDDAPILMAYR